MITVSYLDQSFLLVGHQEVEDSIRHQLLQVVLTQAVGGRGLAGVVPLRHSH